MEKNFYAGSYIEEFWEELEQNQNALGSEKPFSIEDFQDAIADFIDLDPDEGRLENQCERGLVNLLEKASNDTDIQKIESFIEILRNNIPVDFGTEVILSACKKLYLNFDYSSDPEVILIILGEGKIPLDLADKDIILYTERLVAHLQSEEKHDSAQVFLEFFGRSGVEIRELLKDAPRINSFTITGSDLFPRTPWGNLKKRLDFELPALPEGLQLVFDKPVNFFFGDNRTGKTSCANSIAEIALEQDGRELPGVCGKDDTVRIEGELGVKGKVSHLDFYPEVVNRGQRDLFRGSLDQAYMDAGFALERFRDKNCIQIERYAGFSLEEIIPDFFPGGIYFFDEPGIQFSPEKKMLMTSKILEKSAKNNCQIFIVTHHPEVILQAIDMGVDASIFHFQHDKSVEKFYLNDFDKTLPAAFRRAVQKLFQPKINPPII